MRIDDLPPYARFLGLTARRDEKDGLIWTLPFEDNVVGRPGFLHGGAIAGLLEFAAMGEVKQALGDADVTLKPINVTVTYMRGGVAHETFAAATITRLGNRVANVEAHAWQHDREKPIAVARMNLLLRRRERKGDTA